MTASPINIVGLVLLLLLVVIGVARWRRYRG